jgi:hypothetical protein
MAAGAADAGEALGLQLAGVEGVLGVHHGGTQAGSEEIVELI